MKTFDEKDLITWSNREKAVIGNEYYFGNTIDTIQGRIETGDKSRLDSINNHTFNYTFKKDCANYYACILPVDAVKERKTYRACKNIKEFYCVINNSTSTSNKEEDYIYALLLNKTLHVRNKFSNTEYYSVITSFSKNKDGDIRILFIFKCYISFDELFNNYEIEINGEWKPFGVLEK